MIEEERESVLPSCLQHQLCSLVPPHPGTTVLPSCKNTPKVVTSLLVLSWWERKCKHLGLRGVLEVKTPLVKPLVQCPAYSKCSINESS